MRNILFVTSILILSVFLPGIASGQSLDSIRQTAWDGHYAEARKMCMERADYPENIDILFLVGQTHHWEGNSASAKNIFQDILAQHPDHTDAISALTSINNIAGEFKHTISLASDGLSVDANNEDLLYNRAFAYAEIKRMKEARSDLDRLLTISPGHSQGLELKESMASFQIPGSIGIYQSVQWHNDPYERRFYITTVEAPIGDKNVKIIPRFSYGSLLSGENVTGGSQSGLDIYPLTGPDSYLYLNYAFSPSDIFPAHRSAIEWFTSFGAGWEASAGVRYLYWNDHRFLISTSMSKYLGKWLAGFRMFYTPQSDNDVAAIASLRRYFNIPSSYIHFFFGYGSNPDRTERQMDFSETTKPTRLNAGSYTSLKIKGPFYARLLAEFNFEEYQPEDRRNVFLIQTGIEYKF